MSMRDSTFGQLQYRVDQQLIQTGLCGGQVEHHQSDLPDKPVTFPPWTSAKYANQ